MPKGYTREGIPCAVHAIHSNPGGQFGENNPQWKGGKKSWVERAARKAILKAGRSLEWCEMGNHPISGRYNIHHKDGNKHNNRPRNLVVCCVQCHNGEHGRYDRRDNKGRFVRADSKGDN